MERVNTNLYKKDGKYYRLFGSGVTPNGCWVINPKFIELKDIEVATGKDVYGEEEIHLGLGEVWSSGVTYIYYNPNDNQTGDFEMENNRGRKTDLFKKEKMNELFFSAKNVGEFIELCNNLNPSTARVYWYRLCKENNRVVEGKRGRKSTKVNYETLYNKLVENIKKEMEIAKEGKKSTTVFKKLLGEI